MLVASSHLGVVPVQSLSFHGRHNLVVASNLGVEVPSDHLVLAQSACVRSRQPILLLFNTSPGIQSINLLQARQGGPLQTRQFKSNLGLVESVQSLSSQARQVLVVSSNLGLVGSVQSACVRVRHSPWSHSCAAVQSVWFQARHMLVVSSHLGVAPVQSISFHGRHNLVVASNLGLVGSVQSACVRVRVTAPPRRNGTRENVALALVPAPTCCAGSQQFLSSTHPPSPAVSGHSSQVSYFHFFTLHVLPFSICASPSTQTSASLPPEGLTQQPYFFPGLLVWSFSSSYHSLLL